MEAPAATWKLLLRPRASETLRFNKEKLKRWEATYEDGDEIIGTAACKGDGPINYKEFVDVKGSKLGGASRPVLMSMYLEKNIVLFVFLRLCA